MNSKNMNEKNIIENQEIIGFLVKENHICRLVEHITNLAELNENKVYTYEYRGRPAYSSGLMSSLIIMGFLNNIFSSNNLNKSITNYIPLLYLSKGLNPKKTSLNNFKHNNKEFFSEILKITVELAEELNLVNNEFSYIDGVKFKSNTNSFKNIYFSDIYAFKKALKFDLFSKESRKLSFNEINTIHGLESKNIDENHLKSIRDILNKKHSMLKIKNTAKLMNISNLLEEETIFLLNKGFNEIISDETCRIYKKIFKKEEEFDYTEEEVENIVLHDALHYLKYNLTKELNKIYIKPLERDIKEFLKTSIKNVIDKHIDIEELDLERIKDLQEDLANVKKEKIRKGFIELFKSIKNLSLCYNDPDAKWRKFMNASGHNGKNNMAPGYTYQVLIDENRIISTVTISNNPSDTKQLIPILKELEKTRILKGLTLTADNAYASLENLLFCKEKGINLITPTRIQAMLAKKDIKHFKKNSTVKMQILSEKEGIKCQKGKILKLIKKYKIGESNNVDIFRYTFQIQECVNCSLKKECNNNKNFKTFSFAKTEIEFQHIIKMNLKENQETYNKRKHKIENIFGDWKHNKRFIQSYVSSIEKNEMYPIILAICQNISIIQKHIQNNPKYTYLYKIN
jgi:hypothetical protein